MRLLIRFLDDLTQRGAPPLFAHPVPNRTNDAVAHHQHDEDEEAADDDLPPRRESAAEKILGPLHQESTDKRSDKSAAAAHSRPDYAFDRKHRPCIEKRDDADPGGIESAVRRSHES